MTDGGRMESRPSGPTPVGDAADPSASRDEWAEAALGPHGGEKRHPLLPASILLGIFGLVVTVSLLDAAVLLPEPWQHVRPGDVKPLALLGSGLLAVLAFARTGCLAGMAGLVLVLVTLGIVVVAGGPDPERRAHQIVTAHRGELDVLAEEMLAWHGEMETADPLVVSGGRREDGARPPWLEEYERFRSRHAYDLSPAEIHGALLVFHERPLTQHLIADHEEWSGIAYLRTGSGDEIDGRESVRHLEGPWYFVTTMR